MGILQQQQFFAFLYAIVTGILLGTLYDCFRIVRVFFGVSRYTQGVHQLDSVSLPLIGTVSSPDRSEGSRFRRLLVLSVGDVMFFLIAGCVFCIFLYSAASGCFRWFYVFGAGVGFLLYYSTVGRLVMLFSEMLVLFLRVFFRYVFWLSCVPFRIGGFIVLWVFRQTVSRIWMPIYSEYKHQMRIRYTRRVRAQLKRAICFDEADLI